VLLIVALDGINSKQTLLACSQLTLLSEVLIILKCYSPKSDSDTKITPIAKELQELF
jgi:hypothetical protein